MIATIREPTTNSLGEPLTDLAQLLVFINMVNQTPRHYALDATSPKGGGTHRISLDGFSGPIIIQAIAVDFAGHQSDAVILEFDVPVDPKPSPPTIEVA